MALRAFWAASRLARERTAAKKPRCEAEKVSGGGGKGRLAAQDGAAILLRPFDTKDGGKFWESFEDVWNADDGQRDSLGEMESDR